ncbi:MAG TPA: protease inhibitor I42 family protein [Solirubrobacteraceae bacterium]|jgi:inhibitor of cysteine peptidase
MSAHPGRRVGAVAAACLCALAVTAPAQAREVVATGGDSGRRIVLARGDTLRVSLEENPSTGYAWRTARRPAREVLRRRSDRFVEPAEQDPPVVGAPGRREITWRAVGRGRTRLTLRLVPPGEGRPPERSFRLKVVVRKASRATCAGRGRTVARNGAARVWRRGPAYVGEYRGCAFASGRRTALNPHDGQVGDEVVLAGDKVAFMRGDADNMHWRVIVRDLGTGRLVHSGRAHLADQVGDENGGPASRIRLRRDGAVAWLACVSIAKDDSYCAEQEVHVIGTDHQHRVIDVAPIRSLRLDGATVRWERADGERRSAPLS